ncbi:MAG: hypothetical protein UV75_C0008G0002 [Candidatus Giovannonibacteria bacterium GW2011_GWA1_43_15]|uniref:Uncharacterized protein n=2 Tax=Parcubacteria group TaxID=1794811 RepID=A0A0G1LT75_9BACT|nr:MAG: hypothetical protein UV75_C0008G0002 [Candidatus Giovannonibacteria bacterium GW2011_GWA1_43_15]KKT21127.1 MAG: hypothetical protein UW05_C0017G0002 [Candidatus Giovannonibacteria bacterium GW2011_GWC2_43_8]KKT62969.1 MAG: hypothetical protein UW55_C0007G0009 [Candidatus Giovannonibacteria bacterium GW2011_GWA2_44_26]OGF70220.1 MAG: hypothetical protein A3C76_01020 [Candidatus Giovannonibacteria bacterium RIFCSPHIGHO2_02_FULL_44_51]OGF72484.1 MAG: hypothetical protein A3E35_02855 [Candi
MKKKILIIIFLFSLAGTALAYNLLQPLPGVGQTVDTFPDYITKIIPFILGLAAVLAVVMIVIGGIEYAVTEAIDAKADAKDRITQAILGLLLALISWLILSTINPELVNLKLNIPGLPGTQQTGPDPISLPCTNTTQSECAPGFCDILSGQSVGMCKLYAGTCQKPADCSSNICNIPSGSTIGACTNTDVVPPPSAKIESACLSSVGIILSPTTNACDSADCASRGGSCSKFITLPPTLAAQTEKRAVIVKGQFSQSQETLIQNEMDAVYASLPDAYANLKKPVLILNADTIDDINIEVGVSIGAIEAERGRSFSGTEFKHIQTTVINGEQAGVSNPFYNSGTYFQFTLVHEMAHALATEKFGDADGNSEWKNLHTISVSENRGVALPEVLGRDKKTAYAYNTSAEDLAMAVNVYVMTNGQYKTGNARSDEILSQKFNWLEQNGFVKKMR